MYMTSEADINQITVPKKSYAQKVLFVFFWNSCHYSYLPQTFSKGFKGLFLPFSSLYTGTTAK